MLNVTLSLDTSIYASGDVLADTQVVTDYTSLFGASGAAVLTSLTVIDEDDQKAAFDVYFLDANVTMGTENAAPSITDANARNILGFVSIATADYKDIGGVSIACIKNIWLPANAPLGMWVAVVNGSGTPTYTASGVKLRLGFLPLVQG